MKNGQGKKNGKKKAGGRRGLFAIFTRGKRGYVRVNPYRRTLKFSKTCPVTAALGLHAAFSLYPRMCIQNNLSENVNSVLQSILRLRGPKTAGSVERRLRAVLIVRNDPTVLDEIEVQRAVRGQFFLDNVTLHDYAGLVERGWEIEGWERVGVAAN